MGDRCNDYGDRLGCLGEADPRYTMDFTDVKPGAFVFWCAHCGPEAHALNEALQEAFDTRPGFASELEKEIERAEEEMENKLAPVPHG